MVTAEVTVHRGLSRFSRRDGRCLINMLNRRENGTVPVALREWDRSMFSANRFLVKYICSPKNGPVRGWRVNGYRRRSFALRRMTVFAQADRTRKIFREFALGPPFLAFWAINDCVTRYTNRSFVA
jgi:hypothetical protein